MHQKSPVSVRQSKSLERGAEPQLGHTFRRRSSSSTGSAKRQDAAAETSTMALFRIWDYDGDGFIDREEWSGTEEVVQRARPRQQRTHLPRGDGHRPRRALQAGRASEGRPTHHQISTMDRTLVRKDTADAVDVGADQRPTSAKRAFWSSGRSRRCWWLLQYSFGVDRRRARVPSSSPAALPIYAAQGAEAPDRPDTVNRRLFVHLELRRRAMRSMRSAAAKRAVERQTAIEADVTIVSSSHASRW